MWPPGMWPVFTATGPDGTVYDLMQRTYCGFSQVAYNAWYGTLDPPTASIPDGEYTYEIENNLGETATNSAPYAFYPVPDFSSDFRIPADNAYFATDTPSFSWSRVEGDPGDGTYVYSVRDNGLWQAADQMV